MWRVPVVDSPIFPRYQIVMSDPDPTDEPECEGPCAYDEACEDCRDYWERVVREGLWKPGAGWRLDRLLRYP